MATPSVRHAPDLRKALERLPKPDGIPEIRVTIDVAEGASAEPAPGASQDTVEFHRGTLTTSEGALPVWVYEGPLALDDAATPADHAPARVEAWLREVLGPRCVAVDVTDVEEHEATVRIAATTGAPLVSGELPN